jgi:hypothetical protein
MVWMWLIFYETAAAAHSYSLLNPLFVLPLFYVNDYNNIYYLYIYYVVTNIIWSDILLIGINKRVKKKYSRDRIGAKHHIFLFNYNSIYTTICYYQ